MAIRRGIPPLLVLLALGGCTADEPSGVQVGEVRRAPVSEVVEAPGTIGARATATLRSPAQGTVAKVYVRDGERVEKGRILVRISSPQAEDQLDQARKADELASASANAPRPAFAAPTVNLAGLDTRELDREVARRFDRARREARKVEDATARKHLLGAIDLAEEQHRAQRRALAAIMRDLNRSVNGVLSQLTGQLSSGLGGLTESMASLQAASRTQTRAALRTARATVAGLSVKAPFDGVVTLGTSSGGGGGAPDLSALLGQVGGGLGQATGGLGGAAEGTGGGTGGGSAIAAGVPVGAGDPVVTVTDVSALNVSADVDETDVLLVKRGTPAQIELDAVPGATYTAEVTGVGITPLQGTTGGVSYPVRLKLGSGRYDDGRKAPTPKPGMSAVTRLTVKDSPDAVAVPASAVVTSGRDSVVWAVRADGTAERRTVRLGAQGEALVEVLSGLAPGDQVVVRGADGVRAGQRVR
ncbi:multidrug efflux pump subunit AcrA (membrane-fusion protein) [Thermocatellispora tengchongensis]|uniref:Multidrug efflux pump subunit AcrA (Membrane-fusion protein) n=1 Tax=Thermocatellispora tengchongensis TaxID=1073253 RepID=A0A840PDL9_9ACTN|nr:HlyD family efflux transporter periplasmic adaptor subunit [Thermocatellispora tengchongensis]MBB5137708.1 multidrug efflux pump subunit AcrA (membrane-fusion protein) [Thermocatellispora tengchongensis]